MNNHSHLTDKTNKIVIDSSDFIIGEPIEIKDSNVSVKYIEITNSRRYYYFAKTFTDYYIQINKEKGFELLEYNFFLPVKFNDLEDMNSRRWCIPYFKEQYIQNVSDKCCPRRCMGSGFFNMFLQFDWDINNINDIQNDNSQCNFRVNYFSFNDVLRPNMKSLFVPASGFADEEPLKGSIMDYYIRVTEESFKELFETTIDIHIMKEIEAGYFIGDKDNNGLMGLNLTGYEYSYPHFEPVYNIKYYDYTHVVSGTYPDELSCRL